MSVTLQPSEFLRFNRAFFSFFPWISYCLTLAILKGPLTRNVTCSLNIANPNADPVSFKVNTTAPKVRPSRLKVTLTSSVSTAVQRTTQYRKS